MEPSAAQDRATKYHEKGRARSVTRAKGDFYSFFFFSLKFRTWRRKAAVFLNQNHDGGRVSLFRSVLSRAKVYLITNHKCCSSPTPRPMLSEQKRSGRLFIALFQGLHQRGGVDWSELATSGHKHRSHLPHSQPKPEKDTQTHTFLGRKLSYYAFLFSANRWKVSRRWRDGGGNVHLTPKDGWFSSWASPALQNTKNLPLMLLPTVTEGGGRRGGARANDSKYSIFLYIL